jgi:hypothetical protein
VGPDCIVVYAPALDDLARVRQAEEPVFVQALVAEAAVEALDVGILVRLARVNEVQSDALRVRPGIEGSPDELRPIVPAEWRSAAGGGSILGAGQAEPRRGP